MLETIQKLYRLLNARERRNAVILLGIMLVQGITEAIGVVSVVPFIAVLSDPQRINSNSYLAALEKSLSFSNWFHFLVFLAALVLLATLVRIGATALTSFATNRYAVMRSFSLSKRLLATYLSQPYAWFLSRHSVDMSKTLLSEVDELVDKSLMRGVDLCAQMIVATCLIALVLIAQPLVATTVGIILLMAYSLIYFVVRPFVKTLGRDRFLANRQRYQTAMEMLSGIKEIKVRGLELVHLQRFEKAAARFARRRASLAVYSQMPRYLLEAVALSGIMLIVLALLIQQNGNLAEILPLLGLYAFAGLRLLPTVQKIYMNLISLRFGGAALDAVYCDLMQPSSPVFLQPQPNTRIRVMDRIELKKISFTYPGCARSALKHVSLTIPANSAVGIVGTTGAGKTTLIDIILGLLEPQEGELIVDGKPINEHNLRHWQQAIGYVPQQTYLLDDSVAANIAFGVDPFRMDMRRVEEASRVAELHRFVSQELAQGYQTRVGERGVRLSGGQRQRIALARALYHDPDVLVLDEATSALDQGTEKAVMTNIRSLADHKTVIIIAHRLSTVKACDCLFLFEHGSLTATGTYQELLLADSKFRDMAISA